MKHALLLLIAACLLLLPGTSTLPLMDRDEPRFAQATQEMIDRDEWAIPYFNGEYRFDKPPLIYWLMRPHYWLLGKTELAARLPTVETAWLVALVLFAMGRRFFRSSIAGLGAGLAWLVSLQELIHGRLSVADMPMVLSVALTYYALMRLFLGDGEWEMGDGKASADSSSETPSPISQSPSLNSTSDSSLRTPNSAFRTSCFPIPSYSPAPRYLPYLLGVAMGLGFLAKGPIAWFVPILGLILTRFVFFRKPLPWRRLKLQIAIPIALVMVAGWGVPALIATKGLYWQVGMVKHVGERAFESFNDRVYIPGVYYLGTIFISLFPWILFLPGAWAKRSGEIVGGSEEQEKRNREWSMSNATLKRALLLGWFIAPIIVFSFYKTQLPHYIMPGFPAFFLLLWRDGLIPDLAGKFQRRWFGIVFGIFLVIGLVLLATWILFPWTPEMAPARSGLLYMGVMILALLAIGVLSQGSSPMPWHAAAAAMLVAISISHVAESVRQTHPLIGLLPDLEAMKSVKEFRSRGYTEPSQVFYRGGHWDALDLPGNMEQWLAGKLEPELKGSRGAVIETKEWKLADLLKAWFKGEKFPPEPSWTLDPKNEAAILQAADKDRPIHRVQGYNAARSMWVEVFAVEKK